MISLCFIEITYACTFVDLFRIPFFNFVSFLSISSIIIFSLVFKEHIKPYRYLLAPSIVDINHSIDNEGLVKASFKKSAVGIVKIVKKHTNLGFYTVN